MLITGSPFSRPSSSSPGNLGMAGPLTHSVNSAQGGCDQARFGVRKNPQSLARSLALIPVAFPT
jgi:hypothetical protein